MIRKMVQMNASTELLHEIFGSSLEWSKWMPGIASTRTVSESGNRKIIWVEGNFAGIAFAQEVEVVKGRDFVSQKQLEGWPVKWGVTWRFIKPPSGSGATVVAEVETEFSMMAPKSMINNILRRMVAETLDACRKRAEGMVADQGHAPVQAEIQSDDGILLSVYQSEKGLEIRVGDRSFVIGV